MDASKEYIDEVGGEATQDVSLSICRTKPRRVKVAKKVNQRKSKLMGCTCRLKYNPASLSTTSNDQDFIPIIPWHAIFEFLVPILLGVLQIEYQNKKESPFDTHPFQKHTFLTAICVYGALLGINFHTKTTHGGYLEKILSYGLLLSGALSSLSLLSILLQQHLLWIMLIMWGSIPLILARHTLKSSACWVMQMLAKLITWYVCKHSSAGGNICPRVEGI